MHFSELVFRIHTQFQKRGRARGVLCDAGPGYPRIDYLIRHTATAEHAWLIWHFM